MDFMIEAINTLNAKPWELWMARFFGRTQIAVDSGYIVTIAYWRGKGYVISHKRADKA